VQEVPLSTTPENGTPAAAVIVSMFASAAGAAISINAAAAPTSPAMRRINQPFIPLIV